MIYQNTVSITGWEIHGTVYKDLKSLLYLLTILTCLNID